jgi:hypothetical protein
MRNRCSALLNSVLLVFLALSDVYHSSMAHFDDRLPFSIMPPDLPCGILTGHRLSSMNEHGWSSHQFHRCTVSLGYTTWCLQKQTDMVSLTNSSILVLSPKILPCEIVAARFDGQNSLNPVKCFQTLQWRCFSNAWTPVILFELICCMEANTH